MKSETMLTHPVVMDPIYTNTKKMKPFTAVFTLHPINYWPVTQRDVTGVSFTHQFQPSLQDALYLQIKQENTYTIVANCLTQHLSFWWLTVVHLEAAASFVPLERLFSSP